MTKDKKNNIAKSVRIDKTRQDKKTKERVVEHLQQSFLLKGPEPQQNLPYFFQSV
jgi:hypothetical protein